MQGLNELIHTKLEGQCLALVSTVSLSITLSSNYQDQSSASV